MPDATVADATSTTTAAVAAPAPDSVATASGDAVAPAAAPPVAAPAAPAVEAPPAPIVYDLKLADGSTAPADVTERIAAIASARGLSNDAAQAMYDAITSESAAHVAAWTAEMDRHRAETLADPALGKTAEERTAAIQRGVRVIDAYAKDDPSAAQEFRAFIPTLLDSRRASTRTATVADDRRDHEPVQRDLDDAVVLEANGTTGHKTTDPHRHPGAHLAQAVRRRAAVEEHHGQVTDSFGMLENYSRSTRRSSTGEDGPAFRLSEDRPIIEGIAQELAQTIFYGNEKTAPEEFTGLAARYNSLTAENGVDNIISGGGSGSTTRRSGSSAGAIRPATASARRARRPASRSRTRADDGPELGRLDVRGVRHALQVGHRALAARLALRGPHREHRRLGPHTLANTKNLVTVDDAGDGAHPVVQRRARSRSTATATSARSCASASSRRSPRSSRGRPSPASA
jgi:hypothetical protein